MKNAILILAVACLLYGCKKGTGFVMSYAFFYINESDYTISVYRGKNFSREHTYNSIFPIKPGQQTLGVHQLNFANRKEKKETKVTKVAAFCWGGGGAFPCRVYFNKGKPDERYVTYVEAGFKPRDFSNPEECRYEKVKDLHARFYYTFTNEDYENAEKHENTTPIPIPECDGPNNCWKEGGVICYPPCEPTILNDYCNDP